MTRKWGLTGAQRKQLKQGLISAYLTEESLELMLDEELDLVFNEISEGRIYSAKVNNLIKWAESQGRLRELVIGASKGTPGNPALKACVQELLPVLADGINEELLPRPWVAALLTICQKLQGFAIAQFCLEQAIPDVWVHSSGVKKDLEDTSLATSVKWLILLELLLATYRKRTDGSLYILKFVNCLQQHSELLPSERQSLSQWLEQVRQAIKPSISSDLQLERVFEQGIEKIRGYLVIAGIPPITAPSAESQRPPLWIQGAIALEAVYQDKIVPYPPMPLQDFESRLLSDLTWLQDNLSQWVFQAEAQLGSESRKHGCAYDLTIEFLFPYEYLAEIVDQWDVYDGDPRWNCLVPVGKKHRVVMRSLDRLKDHDLFNRLVKTWQRVEQLLESNPNIAENTTEIEALLCLDGTWNKRDQLALMLTCSKQACRRRNKARLLGQLFQALLTSGTPLFLWSRQCNLLNSNVTSEMKELLQPELLLNLDQFLEAVRRLRESAATNQHLGRHLSVLYDEPTRLSQLEQLLPQANQFWGMGA